MSTIESKPSSASESSHAHKVNGGARNRRQRWWLGRIEGAPLFRHLSLWQKLLIIVVILLLPTGLLLRDFVGKSSEEIVRMRRELCVESYAQPLKRILSQQIAISTRAPSSLPHEQAGSAKTAMTSALGELGDLSATGCGSQPGMAKIRLPETLAALRSMATQAAGDAATGDESRRRMREAVAAWFRQIALVANETQTLDPGAVNLDDATLRRLPEAAWRIERMVELGDAWSSGEEVPLAKRAELISTIDGFAADLADIERDLLPVASGGGASASGQAVVRVGIPLQE
ncbi:MAG TPA: hypothetical protein VIM14_03070, partial [Polyangia bacterium]